MKISRFNHEGYYDPTPYLAFQNIPDPAKEAEKEKQRRDRLARYRPIVYICSPYAGDVKANVLNARRYCRFAVQKDCIPIASHLFFPNSWTTMTQSSATSASTWPRCCSRSVLRYGCSAGASAAAWRRRFYKAETRGMPIRYFTEKWRKSAMDEVLSALGCVPVRECSYAEWLETGMALKDAGYACEVWDEWSRDDSRYVPGDCEHRWAGFRGAPRPVTVRSILALARRHGWFSAAADFADDTDATPAGMLARYIETLYQPEETVGFATQVKADSHGRYKPVNTNLSLKAADFIERLEQCGSIEEVIGPTARSAARGYG